MDGVFGTSFHRALDEFARQIAQHYRGGWFDEGRLSVPSLYPYVSGLAAPIRGHSYWVLNRMRLGPSGTCSHCGLLQWHCTLIDAPVVLPVADRGRRSWLAHPSEQA